MLAACGPYPRDVSGTLDRIERSQVIRIGFAELRSEQEAKADRFVDRLQAATGATARVDTAPAEAQLARLEDGQLDLVIGEFAQDTPWLASVAVLEPLDQRSVGGRHLGLAAAAANGENRWIALVEREIRNGGAGPS